MPSTSLPPKNAPSWTIDASYMDSQKVTSDHSELEGGLQEVSVLAVKSIRY